MIREFVTLTKPRITLLNVAATAAGLWLAPGSPTLALALFTLVGTSLLVGAANTLNMVLERDVDGLMTRTKNRPLPAGRMSPVVAAIFGGVQAAIGIPLLLFGTNPLTAALGVFALVSYVWLYTPLKQKTPHSLLVGAVPGAMPPLLGWTAASGGIGIAALALFLVVFFWQVPHFLAIAMVREDDYRKAGIKVLPVVRGTDVTKNRIAIYLALQVLVTLLLVPLGLGGTVYFIAAAVLGAAMLGIGVYGLGRPVTKRWAHGLFVASIMYLPVLLGLLFV